MKSILEEVLYNDLEESNLLDGLQRQYKFSPERKWAADFAYPTCMLLIEVEGGSWSNGRHNRGEGFRADCEKYNAAVLAGFRLLRFTSDMVASREALRTIRAALGRS